MSNHGVWVECNRNVLNNKVGRPENPDMAKGKPVIIPKANNPNATDEQLAAADRLQEAEEKIVDEFRKGVIDFKTAAAELNSVQKRLGREAGMTQEGLQHRRANMGFAPKATLAPDDTLERGRTIADSVAPALGRPGYEMGRAFRGMEAMTNAGGISGIASNLGKGGAAGAGAAAGLGGALMLIDLAVEKQTKATVDWTRNVYAMGEAASKVAGNDGLGALNVGVENAAKGLEDVPVVGKYFAAELRATVAPLNAFTKTVDAFNTRARELAQFNPVIGMAAARSDMRRIFSDMEEGRRMQGQYALLVTQKTNIDVQTQRIMTDIKTALLPFINLGAAGLTAGLKHLEKLTSHASAIGDSTMSGLEMIGRGLFKIPVVGDDIKKVCEKIAALMAAQGNDANDPVRTIMEMAGRVNVGMAMPDHAAQAMNVNLGVPLLQQ